MNVATMLTAFVNHLHSSLQQGKVNIVHVCKLGELHHGFKVLTIVNEKLLFIEFSNWYWHKIILENTVNRFSYLAMLMLPSPKTQRKKNK